MIAKHTPGPWIWGPNFDGLYGAENEVLEHQPYEGMWLAYGESQKANARLIAAAPDLLEALRDMVAGVTKSENFHTAVAERQLILGRARAAIAKAEGA